MSKKNVKIYKNGELLVDNAVIMDGFFDRLIGLMFSLKSDKKRILVFKNTNWIHSFFCFFKFDALYLDKSGLVRAYKINIPPFIILKPVFGAIVTIEFVNCCFEFKKGDKITIDE